MKLKPTDRLKNRRVHDRTDTKNPGSDWPEFESLLGKLLCDSIEVWKERDTFAAADLVLKRENFQSRLSEIIERTWTDSQILRLIKRLRRHEADLLTFIG